MADADDGCRDGLQRFRVPNATIRDTAGHSIIDSRGLFVIHAALLRTGKVLMFGGHVEDSHYATRSYIFNPDNPSVQMTPRPFPTGADLFCCHMVQVPDGRILAMGGSENFHAAGDTSFGAKHIAIYDFLT